MKRLMAAGGGVGMILDALRRAQSMRWQGGRFGMGYQPLGNFPQGDLLPDAVRGAALGARAWIAVTQGSEEKFLADWRRDADRRKLSPEDRLIELSAMQAPEELTAEAQALAAAPDVTADQLLLAAQVLQNRPAPGRAVNADQERLVALYERLAAMSGGGFDPPSLAAVEFLRQAGHGEVAGALLDKMLAKLDRKDPRQTLAAISACMTLDRLEDARKLLGDLVVELQSTSAGTPGAYGQSMQIGWELGCRMLQRKELRAQGVELLAAILRESYGSTARLPGVPVFVSGLRGTRPMFGSPQWSLLSPENLENAVPLATKWINYWDRERLRGLHRALKSTGMLDAFLAELNRQEAAMHGEAGLYPRMAEVNLLWWDGRKKDAVARTRAIAKEFPDVDLGAFLASMLLAMKDYAGAQTALDAAPANDRDAAIRNIILGFSLATMERNREKAKALLGPFEKLCPQSDARYAVSNILDSLGLGEEARRMRNTGRGAGGRSEPPLAKRMRELSADKDRKQAVSIARAVLLGGTPSTLVEQRDNVRSSALDTLRRFSALEDFIVETDAQLRKQPDSLKLNGLMAELTRYGDSGRAIPYYRKLSELLPEDSRIRQTLAGLLRSGKRSGEAAEIYRKSFQTDFMGMMSGSYSDVFETFRDAGKIPELLDLFEQGSKAHRAELAEQYSGVFRWYGEQLAQAGDLASAERIYRMGIDAGVRDSELQRAYLDLLIRQGREKDAAQWVGEMLFPKPSPPPRLLAWSYSANRGMDNSPWRSWTSRGDGRERNMGDELLQTVKDPAALESFRERSREIRQRQPDDDTATMADLFLRVHCRDATVLEELRTMVAHPDRGPLQNVDFGSAIAYDLVDWPEGKPLALDLSLAARDRRTSPNLPFGACVQYTMPLVDLALECGRSDVARRELKSLVEKARAAGGNVANQVGSDTIFRIMDLSLDAGIASEAFGMLEAIKENAPPNNSIREEIARREADYRIAAGLPAPPQAIVWQAAENPDGAVTLAWRLGAARASNGRDGRVNVSQRDLPALDGKYDLELIVESPPNVRRRIATIKGANFTGRWTGRLPAAARRVVGELRARGDSAAIYGGVEIPIGGKGNLVRNPDLAASPDGRALEGWSASAASVRQIAKGGPDAWSPAMEIDASAHEVRLEGEFIPLEPDHDYQEMAWCVSLNGGGYSVGVEYFDENKKRIDSDSCSTWNERGCWGLASQGLTTRENSRSGFRRVTREARWMRPYLEFSGVVRMSGLRISELPPPDESEEDE
jgi:tetratricopeptide (TPR) repeat protein